MSKQGKRVLREGWKARKRAEALERATARNDRSPQEQLSRLDSLGHEATQERARLERKIANAS